MFEGALALHLLRIPYSSDGSLVAKAAPGTHEAAEEVISKMNLYPDSEVLELASGTGYFLSRLHKLGFSRLSSVETDMNTYAYEGVRPVQVDLNTGFSENFDKKFDLIIAIEIIEHLDNPRQFLEEIQKLLKPGGQLIVTTPNISFWLSRLQFLFTGTPKYFSINDFKEQRHISPICDHHMKIMLDECGYKLAETKSVASSWGLLLRLLTLPLSLLFQLINRGASTEGNVNLYHCTK